MVDVPSKKRSASSKVSRSKKAYWRKGANVADIEEAFAQRQVDKDNGGTMDERADDDLFAIDVSMGETEKTYTRRQQAALDRLGKRVASDAPVTFPSNEKRKKIAKEKLRKPVERKEEKVVFKGKKFDVWETDIAAKAENAPEDLPVVADHYLKQTRKRRVTRPDIAAPSLRNAVELPLPGVSYNPSAEDYTEYVMDLVEDEVKKQKKDDKVDRLRKLPEGETYATADDIHREAMSGLVPEKDDFAEEDDIDAIVADIEGVPREMPKAKTRRQHKRAKEMKVEARKAKEDKARAAMEQSIFKLKKITKQVNKEVDEHEANIEKQKQQRKWDKAFKTKRLGRGDFVDVEPAFLMQEELVGNLRQLKPQGDLLSDRQKSMQKRNMLPIAGQKEQHRLKRKHKVKNIEKRSARAIEKGTRVGVVE